MINYKTVIESLLKEHNLTVTELAKKADMPPTSIYNILHGASTQPRKATLQKIAEVFGKNIDIFFTHSQGSKEIVELDLVTQIYRYIDTLAQSEKISLTNETKVKIIQNVCEDYKRNELKTFDTNLVKVLVLYHKNNS